MVEPDEIKGSFDSGDPNTTNLYLGNLNPKVMFNYFYLLLSFNNWYFKRLTYKIYPCILISI